MRMLLTGLLTGTLIGVVLGLGAATAYLDRDSLNHTTAPTTADSTSAEKSSESLLDNNSIDIMPVASSDVFESNTAIDSSVSEKLQLSDLTSTRQAPKFSTIYTMMHKVASANFSELEELVSESLQDNTHHMHSDGYMISMVTSRMHELDPQASMDLVRESIENGIYRRNSHLLSELVRTLGETHSDELLSILESLPRGGDQFGLRNRVLAGMARRSPERAMQIAKQSKQGRYNGSEFEILHEWAINDPQSAMDWALSQNDPRGENGYVSMVFSQWVNADYERAKMFLETISEPRLRRELDMSLIYASAAQDPQQAMAYAMGIDDPNMRMNAIHSSLESWGQINPEEAIDYVTYNLNGQEQEMGFSALSMSLSFEYFAQPGASALETLQSIQYLPDGIRLSVQMRAMEQAFYDDPSAALAYIQSIPDQYVSDQLMSSVAYIVPQHDLPLALDLYARSSPSTQSMLASGISDQLYNRNPAEAMEWMQQLPDEQRLQAIYPIIERMSSDNPEQALQLASSMGADPDTGLLHMAFFNVLHTNPAYAQQWLDQASIDENIRQDLRQAAQQMGAHPH